MKVTSGEINKALTALAGLAGELVNAGLVTGTAAKVVGIVIAAVTSLVVYLVPNIPTKITLTQPAPPAK